MAKPQLRWRSPQPRTRGGGVMKNEVALTFPEALQHIVTTSICALRPEDTRLRNALRVVINYQELGPGPPAISSAQFAALSRWIGRRQ
jgi:hypothetical protein